MEHKTEVEPSEELAYWTGVIQADGRYIEKEKKIVIGIHYKSLPMLIKFHEISKLIVGRPSKSPPYKLKDSRYWYTLGIAKLIESLKESGIGFKDPPIPPKWTLEKSEFFGAYLAGVIDGDGDIRIKRPQYPQCAVRISSGSAQKELQTSI